MRCKAHMGEVRNTCIFCLECLQSSSCPVKSLKAYEVQHKINKTDSVSWELTVGGEK